MQSKFGLKDFVLYLLVGFLALSVWLKMAQQDRQWTLTQDVMEKLSSLESQLSLVQNKLDAGVVAAPAAGGAGVGGDGEGAARDESWARPGVPVQWQPPYGPSTDPRAKPGFRAGGEVAEVWEANWPRVTPFISSDTYSRRLQELVLASLGTYDPVTLKMRGQLAEAWQEDPAGLWLRARIRAGARFSDGRPVTAEDVRYTFHDYVMNEQIEAERVRSIYRDSIKAVRAVDDRTVEFEFFEPLFTNSDNALGLLVLPKHVYSVLTPAQINRSTGLLVGAGPFRIRGFNADRQWTPQEELVLERNEQFWGPKPPLAALRFRAIKDELSRLNAFKKGDADVITPAAPQFRSLQNDPEWKDRASFLEWVNMRSGYNFIAWNCGERNGRPTPFGDRRVRVAMTHLLDRERMIRDVWAGVGVVGKSHLNARMTDPELRPWPFDRKRALELLREAGYEDRNGDGFLDDRAGNPFEFEFAYSSGGEIAEKIARFVVDSCAAVGIRVRLRPVDWSVYQDIHKLRDYDAMTLGWGASAPESDPKQIFHSASIRNQGDNFVQWNSPEADRLIDEGRRTLDPEARVRVWRRLERVLQEEQPYTFVRTPPWVRIVNPAVGNVNTYFKGMEHIELFRGGPAAPTPGT